MNGRRILALALATGALALVAVACDSDDSADSSAGAVAERTVYMAAIEPKGTAKVAEEPFPSKALPSGGGYKLEEEAETGEWVVETYRWLPGSVTVNEGDHVTLEVLGVNGKSHAARIEGYDVKFDVARGALTTVEFDADKPGIYQIVCDTHRPAMTGQLVVLAR